MGIPGYVEVPMGYHCLWVNKVFPCMAFPLTPTGCDPCSRVTTSPLVRPPPARGSFLKPLRSWACLHHAGFKLSRVSTWQLQQLHLLSKFPEVSSHLLCLGYSWLPLDRCAPGTCTCQENNPCQHHLDNNPLTQLGYLLEVTKLWKWKGHLCAIPI